MKLNIDTIIRNVTKRQETVRKSALAAASLLVIFLVCKMPNHKQSTAVNATPITDSLPAPYSVHFQQTRAPASRNTASVISQQSINGMRTYLMRVTKELGQDTYGNLAMVLILRELSPQTVQQNSLLKNLCLAKATCPVALYDIFKTGLRRLDSAKDYEAKELLQKQLVKSDVERGAKVELLTDNLTNSQLLRLPEISRVNGKVDILLSSSSQYMLFTGHELLELRVQPITYLRAMMTALARSGDPIGRELVTKALITAYPRYGHAILVHAHKIGIQVAEN